MYVYFLSNVERGESSRWNAAENSDESQQGKSKTIPFNIIQ
jgi:hypothetical protein